MWKKYSFMLTVISACFSMSSSGAAELSKYDYQMNDRHDPFLPFIQSDTGVIDHPVARPQINRGGVPLEPGQLKLAAIIRAQNGWKAMAEDVTGKGYVLQKGTPVGSYATVAKIEAGQVLLEETYNTRFKGTVVKTTVLRLQQEGGK